MVSIPTPAARASVPIRSGCASIIDPLTLCSGADFKLRSVRSRRPRRRVIMQHRSHDRAPGAQTGHEQHDPAHCAHGADEHHDAPAPAHAAHGHAAGHAQGPPARHEPPPAVTAGTKIEWTCPMHPEIIRDAPGNCPICGMALEPRTATLEDVENVHLKDVTS